MESLLLGGWPSPHARQSQVTYLPLAWGWFVQQERVRIGLKAMISLGGPKGVTQVLGAGLRVGGRGGGDATAPAPVPAGSATATVRHVPALLPGVTAGCTGNWPEREVKGHSGGLSPGTKKKKKRVRT